MPEPRTLHDLKNSPWGEAPLRGRTVRDEIRSNLLERLESGAPLFTGIVGYEDTILPQIVNALLARHHFILLGLRGQAKSRLLRELTTLLDEKIPTVAGSEVNDDPFAPISKYARELLGECGDATPIAWLRRDQRYVEKLATPDVTIADLIGDVDPIKAARGGHLLSDELTMHFGLLPRANRGIFAINELPDLSGKVQVGLFNIMQEGDVQIKGYPVRLPLDVLPGLHRQSRGLHGARQDHHAAQGPHRLRGHHALPPHGAARHGDHRAGGLDLAREGASSRCPTSCSSWWSVSPSRRGKTSGWTSAPA